MNLIFLDLALLSSQKFSSLFYHCLLLIETLFPLDWSPAVIFISIPPLEQVSFHPSFPVSRHTLTFPVIQIFPLLNWCLLSSGFFQANDYFNPSKFYIQPVAFQHVIRLDHKLHNLITIHSSRLLPRNSSYLPHSNCSSMAPPTATNHPSPTTTFKKICVIPKTSSLIQ